MNRRGGGVVGTLHDERSDGKRGGPGIHRERIKRWVMQRRDGPDEMRHCRGNNERGSECRLTWGVGETVVYNATGLIHVAPNLMWHSVLFINRVTGWLDTWAEREKERNCDREKKRELSIVSNYRLCSVLSSLQPPENVELESARESGLVENMNKDRLDL